jgi:hypothetical protein
LDCQPADILEYQREKSKTRWFKTSRCLHCKQKYTLSGWDLHKQLVGGYAAMAKVLISMRIGQLWCTLYDKSMILLIRRILIWS